MPASAGGGIAPCSVCSASTSRPRASWWRSCEAAFAPLTKLFASSAKRSLHDLARAHVETATALTAGGDQPWQGAAGEWAAKFFASLLDERA